MFGWTLWEMFTRRSPLVSRGKRAVDCVEEVGRYWAEFVQKSAQCQPVMREIKRVIEKCLHKEREMRPTMAEVLVMLKHVKSGFVWVSTTTDEQGQNAPNPPHSYFDSFSQVHDVPSTECRWIDHNNSNDNNDNHQPTENPVRTRSILEDFKDISSFLVHAQVKGVDKWKMVRFCPTEKIQPTKQRNCDVLMSTY